MKLIGLTICRNSAWCLAASVVGAMRYCDEMVILDHASSDETPDVIRQLSGDYPGRITSVRDDDPTWHEMSHRQRTLDIGREHGGTHFSIVDDDEIVTANVAPRMRQIASSLGIGKCLQLPWLTCWRSLDERRVDGKWGDGRKAVLFCDYPSLHWKTADGYDHHHTHPYGAVNIGGLHPAEGGVLHFQHANWTRLLAKQAWYQVQEVIRWGSIRADYSGTVDETGIKLEPVWSSWWGSERNLLRLDDPPWQLAELKRLVAEYGREKFSAVNFFGIL